ncbi:MAG: ABC transporter substrate-binding protein [Methanobacterium sp.]
MKRFLAPFGIIVLVVLLAFGTYNYVTAMDETIVVGYLPTSLDSALFVANDLGMFKKEGIKVQLVPFRTGSELIDAANKNQIDVGYVGITPVTSSIDQNSSVKIVAAVNQEGSGIVVSNNGTINNITDLKGKKILIPKKGSIQDVLLRYLLLKNNVNPASVNITEMEVPLMQNALISGDVDGYIAWEPYVTQAKIDGSGRILMNSNDIWSDIPTCVVISTNKFMKQKPDQLKKFLKVHVEATDYVNTHEDETALIVSKKLGTNVNVEIEARNNIKFIAVPTTEFENNLMKLVEVQKQLGYIKGNNTDNISSFTDLSYLP